jgi:hypothetical protein
MPTKLLLVLQAAGGPGGIGKAGNKGGAGGGSGAAAVVVIDLRYARNGDKYIIEIPPFPAATSEYYDMYMDFDNQCGPCFFPGQLNFLNYSSYGGGANTRLLTLYPGKRGGDSTSGNATGGAGGAIKKHSYSATGSSGYYWLVQELPGGKGGNSSASGSIPTNTS